MAVPTIIGVTPAGGPARGRNVVQIAGTNFRLPPAPPALGYVGGPAPVTVAVSFGGTAAPYAEAAAATLIVCRAPAWAGDCAVAMPLAVDVRVANLDDAGAEIPGESATSVAAYTLARPSLAAVSFLQAHVAALIAYFRRFVLPNTHLTTSRDYVRSTLANARAGAGTPVIYLVGPRMARDPVGARACAPAEDHPTDPEGWVRLAAPVVADLAFDVYLIAGGDHAARQILALTQALLTTLRDVPALTVDATHTYELLLAFDGFPLDTSVANLSDLHVVQATCAIRGVHLEDEPATIVDSGWRVFDNDGLPTLDVQGVIPP